MANEQAAILTNLGFNTTDLKKGLEEAKAAVAQYKVQAAQADQDLQRQRAAFAEQYSANERRLAQTRLAAAQNELQTKLAGLAKLDAAEKASATTRINILRQTIDAQKQYLQGYDAEAQKITVLQTKYAQLASQAKLASAQKGAIQQAGGEDYRYTLNRVLSGVTPAGAAGVIGAVAGGSLLAELPSLLRDIASELTEAATAALEFGEEMEKTSEKTGISVDELQKLKVVGSTVGLGLTDITRATKFLGAAAVGSDVADENGGTISGQKGAKVLGALGISASGKSPDQLILDVADAFQKLPDGVLKSQAAVALFGRSGLDLIPLLNEGREGFAKISREVENFGLDTHALAEQNQQLEIATAKFDLAMKELSGTLSGFPTSIAQLKSQWADLINYLLRKTELESDTTGQIRAQGNKVNASGATEINRVNSLGQSSFLAGLGGGRAAAAKLQAELDERNKVIAEGTAIFRKQYNVSADFQVSDIAAITAAIGARKAFQKSTEDTTKEQDALKDALVVSKDELEKLAKQFAELSAEGVQLKQQFSGQTRSGLSKQFGAQFQNEQTQGLNTGIAVLQQQLSNTTDINQRIAIQERINQLEKERLATNQAYIDQLPKEIEEKRKIELAAAESTADKLFALAPTPGGVTPSPLFAAKQPANPLENSAIRGGLEATNVDRITTQVAALKAVGGDYHDLLVQEEAARKDLNDTLKTQLQTLLANGVQTDADKQKVEDLTKALSDNKTKLEGVANALKNGLDFEKVQAGFEALAQGIAEFSDHANQVVKAVTRGFETISKNNKFFQNLGHGDVGAGERGIFTGKDANGNDINISDRLQGAGQLAGGVVGNVGQISQGGVGALTGGIGLGSTIGGLFGPAGSLIGSVVGAIGGGIGALFGGSKKKTDKIASDIKQQVKDTLSAINDGTTNLVDGLAQLQKEREDAIKKLSGKKGGKEQLDSIESDIDAQVSQLQQKQKQILDKFNETIGELAAPKGTDSYVQTISQIASTLKDAADAGATTAQQIQYLNASLDQLKDKVGNDLRSAEQNTLELLQKEIDLKQQSADIDAQAAEQKLGIERGLGLARGATAGQTAAQQLRDVETQRQKQQKDLAAQQQLLDAQLGQQAKLFAVNLDGLTLDQQKALVLKDQLDIQQQITAETVEQISNQAAFYAQLAAGQISVPAGVLPSGLNIPTGANYTLGTGNPAPVTVNTPQIIIQYSGTADPKQLADAVRQGIQQINIDRRIGKS